MRAQRGIVIAGIPGQVQRDTRRSAGERVDDAAVLELFKDVARLAGTGEAGEARAAGAHAPGRQGDRKAGHAW